ncbi:16S rRNA (cytidine(1402)-2'-O)-methyltransferase [Hutsoniella sourekii]|uniref:16S rRNA (cytidine(1402)-2'-O)-methyltransferase n=1 Tax=Hutsoniella sourekii TaxID=87650 RepID=UPI0004851074|nr:16S rRNA (cytidine(1402)-2'-O)-methyltransferase [Hutsoniella sourekii]
MQIQKSYHDSQTGKLYLIPTPIGNLEDITLRALRLLKEVDLILAEDTRNSAKLLHHFDITTPMKSFHEHSSDQVVSDLIQRLQSGQSLALISDAGMPLINDPGHPLVQAALEEDLTVIALPGANAALTALVASGLPADRFTYYGFFPRKASDQAKVLKQVAEGGHTAIFYESPYRLLKLVEVVSKQLGPDTSLTLARELSKKYEEYIRASAADLLAYLDQEGIKGECVVLISPSPLSEGAGEDLLPIKDHVDLLMAQQGLKPNQAIKQVAKIQGLSRQEVYSSYHDLDD